MRDLHSTTDGTGNDVVDHVVLLVLGLWKKSANLKDTAKVTVGDSINDASPPGP